MRVSINKGHSIAALSVLGQRWSSSVSGKLVRFLVRDGDHVKDGQPYVEPEVMKMYLTLSAPESGHINIKGAEGSAVDVGDVIALLRLDDPSKVRRAELFGGDPPNFSDPEAVGSKPHQLFKSAVREVQVLLRGFDSRKGAIQDFLELVDDVRVCAGEIHESLSSPSGRIPTHIANQIENELCEMLRNGGITDQTGSDRVLGTIGWFTLQDATDAFEKALWTKHVNMVRPAMANILEMCQALSETSELCTIVSRYAQGSVFAGFITGLLDECLRIEKQFVRRSGGSASSCNRRNCCILSSLEAIKLTIFLTTLSPQM